MVIFEPFWRMDTGNLLLGRLVSHKRKSLCTFQGVVTHVMPLSNAVKACERLL